MLQLVQLKVKHKQERGYVRLSRVRNEVQEGC